jgi:DNA ligase-1
MSHKLIAEIASDNSKLFKEDVIKREALAGNDEFFAGLRFALDNIDSFGVKKLPFRADVAGAGLSFNQFQKLANSLIKRELTGFAALDAIAEAMRQSNDEEWNGWYRRILVKDLQAGFSESTVNKAVKAVTAGMQYDLYIIPTTPYMRCSLPEKSNQSIWDWAKGVFSQTKADGMFAYVNVDMTGFVWVTSRGGTLFPEGMLGIEEAAVKTFKPGTSTHGELTVYQDGVLLERQIGNGILNSVLKGGTLEAGQVVVYDVWDQIPLSAFVPKGKYEVPYHTRYDSLLEQMTNNPSSQIKMIETLICYTPDEALTHYRLMRSRGLEGTICKSRDAIWKDGTSKDLVKQKEVVDVELRVVGKTVGKNKFAHLFGSLICQSEDGSLEVGVSGIPDELRNYIHSHWDEWNQSIVTVRSNGIMYATKAGAKHSLFLPRMVEQRDDKTVADTFAEIEAQFKAAISSVDKDEEE